MASNTRSEQRVRMPLSERAKIFAPFDALKGFREAIAEREEKVLCAYPDFYPLDDDDPGLRDAQGLSHDA